ncbi:MAG: right-handed parallel beta-helix repeat-containing protein [Candidatus Bathyarchaeota archaeon]|nr:right-handed parallel beta-helix repeat-containing protein [Candidatus Bathyarchaeum sp.]
MHYGLRKTVVTAGLFFVLFVMLVVFPAVKVEAEPTTIVVPDDYSTIQAAINAASDGDTVYVDGGIYNEHVVVNKSILLIGKNKKTTIISCTDNAHPTVLVHKDGVTLTGFTIKNIAANVSESRGRLACLHLLHVNQCSVYENIVSDGGYGIWLYGSNYNSVYDNLVSNVNHGIMVESSWDNTILRNTASDSWTGIWIDHASGNILRDNNMVNNLRNLAVTGTELTHYSNDIDASNRVNDKIVYYLINQQNLEISPSSFPDLGFLALISCTEITVKNLNIANNYYGVLLFDTLNSTITQNKISETTRGICAQYSFDLVISENSLSVHTDDGVCIENSQRIRVESNTIQNGGLSGVYLESSNNVTVVENVLKQNLNYGIHLEQSSGNALIGNKIVNSVWGISLRYSSRNMIDYNDITRSKLEPPPWTYSLQGISIALYSNNCSIIGNIITNQAEYGISIQSASYAFISQNNITENNSGLQFEGTSDNTVIGNTISESNKLAIYLSNSNNSIFSSNNFINNAQQIEDHYWSVNWMSGPSVSIWDNGTAGNYWSDYNGVDSNGDGIGDTPYVIAENNQDNKPLMQPVDIATIPEFSSWTHLLVLLVAVMAAIIFCKQKMQTTP